MQTNDWYLIELFLFDKNVWNRLTKYENKIISITKQYIDLFDWAQINEQCWIINRAIGQMSRVFANGPGDRGSIPGRVIPKTQKMVLDAALLNTQHCKVWIKDKVDLSRETSIALLYTVV